MLLTRCLSCLEQIDAGDLVFCSPGPPGGRYGLEEAHEPHGFCVACVRKQIEGDAGIGLTETRCILVGNCPGRFSGEVEDRVAIDGRRRMLEDEEKGGTWRCTFCGRKADCEEGEGWKGIWCRNRDCRRVSCRLCLRKIHWGSPCEVDSSPEVVRCFWCFRMVEKSPGYMCNMLECRCERRTTLCVSCGKDISREKDAHYRWSCAEEATGGEEGCYLFDEGLEDKWGGSSDGLKEMDE